MHTQAAPTQGQKDATKKYALPSGATLHLGRPEFGACGRLKRAIAKTVGASPFSVEEMKTSLKDLKGDPSKGGALLQRLMALISSEEVEAAVFECLKGSTWQPKGADAARIKVDPELFNDERFADAARADYYAICYRAAEAAVLPFLAPLVSLFGEFRAMVDAARASTPSSSPSA